MPSTLVHRGDSQRPCLLTFTSMYGILPVDKGKVVDGAFLDFYKAVHHSILLENIVQLWDERVHNAVGEELAECQS